MAPSVKDVSLVRPCPGRAVIWARLDTWTIFRVDPTEKPLMTLAALAVTAPLLPSCSAVDVDKTDASDGSPSARPTWASAVLRFSWVVAARRCGPVALRF